MEPAIETTEVLPAVQGALFDYSTLDVEDRIRVQSCAEAIRKLMRNTAQQIVEIGEYLIDVRKRLGDDKFDLWLEAEFSWHIKTAYSFMAVAEKFASQNLLDANISSSALYLLAAPSTPAEAREAAVELAKQGETITKKVAKAVLKSVKEAKVRKVKESTQVLPVPEPEPSPNYSQNYSTQEPEVEPIEVTTAASEPDEPEEYLNSHVTITVQLFPLEKGKLQGQRQTMVSVQADEDVPIIKMKKAFDLHEGFFLGAIGEQIQQLKAELPRRRAEAAAKKAATAKPAPAKSTATPAKSTKKPAAKAAKAGKK